MPKKRDKNLLEVQNAAKTMFANIRFLSIDEPLKSIVMTSSVPNEGKTTSMWYLAQAAATAGNRVLIIEADMRRRSLASMLNLHPRYGLHAVLTNTGTLEGAIVPTSVKGLYFLDAEPSIPNPADLLASKRMKALNAHLKETFDYVLYDTPPVGTFVDAAVLGSIADATVVAVRADRVRRAELEEAKAQLEKAGANVIGVCSTFVESSGSEYYYSYYTSSGSKRKHSGKDMPTPVSPADAPHHSYDVDALADSGRYASETPRPVPVRSQNSEPIPRPVPVTPSSTPVKGRDSDWESRVPSISDDK